MLLLAIALLGISTAVVGGFYVGSRHTPTWRVFILPALALGLIALWATLAATSWSS